MDGIVVIYVRIYIMKNIREKIKDFVDNHAILIVIIGTILIFGFVLGAIALSESDDKTEINKYDEAMASQDWGKGYYYDTNEHKVKKYLFD